MHARFFECGLGGKDHALVSREIAKLALPFIVMYINSVTKIADGSCAADYLLPNQAITDLMKQFLRYQLTLSVFVCSQLTRSMDTKRGAEFHPKYSRYEEEASTRHEKDVLSQKEKIVNEKNAEAKKIGMKVF